MFPMVTGFMNYGQQTIRAARYIGQSFMITLSHANRLPINILILFAVMFMNGSEYYKDFRLWTVGNGVTSFVCTSIFVSLITIIPDTSWYGIIWTTKTNQIIEQDLISNGQQIGIHLSTDFFIPFEFISIILLVALIGAIAVARQ